MKPTNTPPSLPSFPWFSLCSFIHWIWYGSKVGRATSSISSPRLTEISQIVWTKFLFMLCLLNTIAHSANSQVSSGILARWSLTKPNLFLSSVLCTLPSETFLTTCAYGLPTFLVFSKFRHIMRIFPRLMTKPIFLYLKQCYMSSVKEHLFLARPSPSLPLMLFPPSLLLQSLIAWRENSPQGKRAVEIEKERDREKEREI